MWSTFVFLILNTPKSVLLTQFLTQNLCQNRILFLTVYWLPEEPSLDGNTLYDVQFQIVLRVFAEFLRSLL